jgi:neutral trehalase
VVDYYLYSGDRSWVIAHWTQIKKAVSFSTEEPAAQSFYSDTAASLRSAINLTLWDAAAGMYADGACVYLSSVTGNHTVAATKGC